MKKNGISCAICRLAEPYLRAKFHLDPFNPPFGRNTATLQTDMTDKRSPTES